MEVCAKHLQATPDRPSERLGREVPPDLEAIVMQCLAKDPDERPQTAQDLCDAMQACADHGRFTPQDARDWWEENAVIFVHQEAPEPGLLTLDIARAHLGTSTPSQA